MLILLLLTPILLLLSLIFFALYFRPPNFPPGPPRLPIFGSLLFLGNPPHAGLRRLTKVYGKICGVYCGNYPGIVLSDLNLIKDAFKDDRFSARPPLRPFLERSWGQRKGLIFGSGPEWAEQRKFAVQVFKDLGMGSGRTENVVGDEVLELRARLKKEIGHPTSINHLFHVAIINALWHLVAGTRFDYDDPKLKELIRMTGDVVKFRSLDANSFRPNVLFFMPWLTKFLPNTFGWNRFLSSFKAIFPTLESYIEKHKVQLASGQHTGDLIDSYLEKIARTTEPGSSFFKDNGERSLLVVLLDLFVAGGETASSNLTWGFLFLATYPEIQAKLHAELDEIVGAHRLPSLADRPRMPYLEAFINEVLRMVTIGALSIFHSTSEPIPNFHGFSLPADTIVFANFWEVHHDPKIWGDPQNFRPERFLDKKGSSGSSGGGGNMNDYLHVFSTGKRICPGEGFARDELFLFTAGLLQEYKFERPVGSKPPCLDPTQAATLRSHDSQIIIKERRLRRADAK